MNARHSAILAPSAGAAEKSMPITVTPRLGEFSAKCIPIHEIEAFYGLTSVELPAERPYIWRCMHARLSSDVADVVPLSPPSMTVASLDGRIGFSEPGVLPSAIALAGLADGSSESDWRLLNAGWAFADAVMISGD